MEGYVAEVFRSIQGEGPHVGVLQVFVRFAGCSLRCAYCDTVSARARVPELSVVSGETIRRIPNPVGADELAGLARSLVEVSPHVHSMSVTGGEPLEQPDFLCAFLRSFRGSGLPVYLETNGLFEDAARAAAPLVDIVSMDVKLPSLCGGGDLFSVYRRVLPLFAGKELFCKVVVAGGFVPEEFAEAARLVAEWDARVPFIIQPATETPGAGAVSGESLLTCYFKAAEYLDDVRVIPQCHQRLGLE